jgi:hypothetical protein
MGPNLSVELSRLHQRDLLRQAEQDGLAAQATAPRATSGVGLALSYLQHAMQAQAPRRQPQLAPASA